MKTLFILIFLLSTPIWGRSKQVDYLGEAIQRADHMVIGQLHKVEMLNKEGQPVTIPHYVGPTDGYRLVRHYHLTEHLKGLGPMPNDLAVEIRDYWGTLKQAQLKIHQMPKIYFFNKNWHRVPGIYEFDIKEKGIALNRWKYKKE